MHLTASTSQLVGVKGGIKVLVAGISLTMLVTTVVGCSADNSLDMSSSFASPPSSALSPNPSTSPSDASSLDSSTPTPEFSFSEGLQDDPSYQEMLADKNAQLDKTIKTDNGEYQFSITDTKNIGPDKPLQVVITPGDGADQQTSLMSSSIVTDDGRLLPVKCDAEMILATPIVMTCSVENAIPSGARFSTGVVVKGEGFVVDVPLNTQ